MSNQPVSTLRAFIAIELSDAVRDALARAQQPLKELPVRVSWVRPENLHLTLEFLGDIAEKRVAAVGEILDAACAETPAFRFDVTGLGAFGSPRRPRVIWAGVPDPPPALMSLQEDLRKRLQCKGFNAENKAWRPHLTLGRVRGPQGVGKLTSALTSANNTGFGEVSVRRILMVQSQLDTSGARYTIIRESGLKGS